jgi:hypothetical protein
MPDAIADAIARVRTIQADVAELRRAIDGQPVGTTDRQYLGRCFDLLDLELAALRDYLAGMG